MKITIIEETMKITIIEGTMKITIIEETMKTFRAQTEERYVWTCPYCGEICDDDCEDPEDLEFVVCEHCGKEARCEGTDR